MSITKPIITEKSMIDASSGVYTFAADLHTTKHQAKEQIEKLFKVHVVSINSIITKGDSKRTGKLRRVKTLPPQKKIKVTLKKGESIDLFDLKEEK